jgi:D-alanyl-D-alanine carboxypeptidase
MPRIYPVKFNIDLSDPANWANGPPQTTAKSWSIFDCKKMITVHSKNLDQKLEIASMTKIMTAYTCCRILFGDMACIEINPKKIYFRASNYASKI